MPDRLSESFYGRGRAPRPSASLNEVLQPYIRNPTRETQYQAFREMDELPEFQQLSSEHQGRLKAAVGALLLQANSANRNTRIYFDFLNKCLEVGLPENLVSSLVSAFDQVVAPPVELTGRAPSEKKQPEAKDYKNWPKAGDKRTPLFKQGDDRWGDRILGDNETIHQSGCALTSLAMAMSNLNRNLITPLRLDKYLDGVDAYSGDSIDWRVASEEFGINATRVRSFDADDIRRIRFELASKRPVVAGVEYVDEDGRYQKSSSGLDHWITLTRYEHKKVKKKDVWIYHAADPATGKEIRLLQEGNKFVTEEPIFNGHYFSVEKGYVLFEKRR